MKRLMFWLRLRCWLRNWHRWWVADLAMYDHDQAHRFKGECSDCGARTYRTGEAWRLAKEQVI